MKLRDPAGGPEHGLISHVIVVAIGLAAVAGPRSAPACTGSAGSVCVLVPSTCTKSMVLGKAAPRPVVCPPGGPALVPVPMTLFLTCPATNHCGAACTNAAAPIVASLTASLYPAPCPAPPVLPSQVSATISTLAATMALPVCSAGGTFNAYTVPVVVPPSTPPGLYCVVGTATVTFSDGMILTQTGDTAVCLVEQAAGQPGVPRLNLELVSPAFPRVAPGDQSVALYRVTNNDPSHSVRLTAFASSRQAAVRPQGANERQGVFSISSPFGDDFPIQFDPGTNCIPLPEHPYTQRALSNSVPVIGPGQSTNIVLGIRSYGQCASGSCSESTLRVSGIFSDGSSALACAGMALWVDTSVPSQNCGQSVNDCNHNGIPDALDIASRRSADQNFNAMPDECEAVISVPIFSSVTPTNPSPGAPLFVQIAFNEAAPMVNVWANGSPLVRTQFFGAPVWQGTIPADTRPGPQTVYFLGKDSRGGLASFIATYGVVGPLALNIARTAGAVTLSWPRPATGFVLDETPHLNAPIPWMPVPFPYQTNATQIFITIPAPADQTFYRLRKP